MSYRTLHPLSGLARCFVRKPAFGAEQTPQEVTERVDSAKSMEYPPKPLCSRRTTASNCTDMPYVAIESAKTCVLLTQSREFKLLVVSRVRVLAVL